MVERARVGLLVAATDRSYAGALAAALGADGIDVVGQVARPGDLLPLLDHGPDVVLIALLPGAGLDGELVATIAARAGVLVLGPEVESLMLGTFEAGALAYLGLDASFGEVAEGVRAVAAGAAVVPPPMLGSLLRHVVRRRREERMARERLEVLTDRERQVFSLVANGFDKQGISQELYISPETVRTHIQNIMRKLGLHTQVEIVALAARSGLQIGPLDD